MKKCAIMISKIVSHRFPGKNQLLWKKNAEILIDCVGLNNVYMLTDDPIIKKGCNELGIKVVDKNINIDDEMSYLDVLRFVYMSIQKEYDIIVTLMCNTINHTYDAVMHGIERIQIDKDASEVRSFDDEGNQSGIFIFKSAKLPEKWHHMGSFVSNGKEIHYKEEWENTVWGEGFK